jgi:chitodextrinase
LTAKAYDVAGNVTSSSVVNITVADATAPTISAVASGSLTQTSATVTWTTNEASDSQVEYGPTTAYGTSSTLATAKVTSHSVGLSGLTASTTYHYQVKSKDAAGNLATSADATFTTAAPTGDTTKPTVSLTAPANGATVSATTAVTATASDNVGVAGVQFKLDGTNLGAEDTAAPYSFSWDTTTVNNGSHTMTAVARDAAGNVQTATTITVTVSNVTVTYRAEDINQDGSVNLLDFSLLSAKFGLTGSNLGRVDINQDGSVNLLDFSLLSAQFGT